MTAAALLGLACPSRAAAAPVVTEVSLTPTSVAPTASVTATLKVRFSNCYTVKSLGVAVRDATGDNLDFPGQASNVRICPGGFTLTTGARTFNAGTYTEFGFYQDTSGNYHNLASQTLTVARPNGGPPPPTAGKVLAFDEEFQGPMAWGSRWVGNTTSAYLYGSHNPNDDKLDWVAQSAVTAGNRGATFTAAPGTHVLENGRRSWNTGLLTTEGSTHGFQVRTGDYLETRVQLPTAYGAWPALWTWQANNTENGNGEVDTFEYHPDHPNLLEFTNHVNPAGFYYTNANTVSPGGWVTIGVHYGATDDDWYVNGVKVFSDQTGVGRDWTANIILNLSVEAGEYHPTPVNQHPFSFSANYLRDWR